MPSDKPTIAVRLEPKLHAEVTKRAKAEGRSVSNWVRLCIQAAMAAVKGKS